METELYSEGDIAEIVRRAAELQSEGGAPPYTPGVTGEELARVAAEVGISPEYLERALAERRAGQTSGVALPRRAERLLPVELGPEEYDAVLEVAKTLPTAPLTQIGSSLQGHVQAGWGQNRLQVTSRNGRTKVVVENEGGVAAPLALLWVVPLCLTPVLGALVAPLAGVAAAAACVGGAFGTYKALDRKGRRDTHALADALQATILERAHTRDPAHAEAATEDVRENLDQR